MSNQIGSKALSRRRFLVSASSLAIASSFPQLAQSATHTSSDRTLSFIHLHTNETLSCCYWKNGQYDLTALAQINTILRDHRTGEVAKIDIQLLDLIHELHQMTQSSSRFEIISGFRSAKTNEHLRKTTGGVAKKSHHMQGKAIDIRLPDVELKTLRDAAISLQAGGVGYYTKSSFLHLDTGRPRNW